MSFKIKSFFLCGLLLCQAFAVLAQTDTSPYSSQGLGKLVNPALANNVGMGGIGIAAGSGLHVNYINPALLYRNNLATFDMALSAEYKDLARGDQRASAVNGGLAYGMFAFPAADNRWTVSVGLMPYSTVDYTARETRSVEGNGQAAQLSLEGEGGISQAFISNGVRLYKNLAAGVRIAYLFGSIDKNLSILPLTNDEFSYRTSYIESLYYSGLVPEFGLYNGFRLGQNTFLSAGIIYQPETSLRVTRNVNFESSSITNPDLPIGEDTIANEPGGVVLPRKAGFGLALEKYLKYTVGVDVSLQQWENFGAYQADSLALPAVRGNEGLKNSMKIAVGGEYIPDASSVDSYFKRVAYRLGFSYQHTPFAVSAQQITDAGLTFGFSLPLSNLSSLNLGMEAGRRGTTANELIRENYFKVLLGVSFNDRWFVRRKYD